MFFILNVGWNLEIIRLVWKHSLDIRAFPGDILPLWLGMMDTGREAIDNFVAIILMHSWPYGAQVTDRVSEPWTQADTFPLSFIIQKDRISVINVVKMLC